MIEDKREKIHKYGDIVTQGAYHVDRRRFDVDVTSMHRPNFDNFSPHF